MNRRDMLRITLASAGVGGVSVGALRADAKRPDLPDATPQKLPRWRGFNLPVAYRGRRRELFEERDFADVAELGFNFLRLALNYHDWTDPNDPKKLKGPVLKQIDRAVEPRSAVWHPLNARFPYRPRLRPDQPSRADESLDPG